MGGTEMDEKLSRILEQSVQLELNVAALYLGFSEAFPEDREFWSQLAKEEENHAALLRGGKLESSNEGRFPADILTTNLDTLIKANKEIEELVKEHKQKPPSSRASALEIAIKAEESTGELDFSCFMRQEKNSPLLELLGIVNRQDRGHSFRIRNYMEEKGIGLPDEVARGQDDVG
jgi:rubrerythrin